MDKPRVLLLGGTWENEKYFLLIFHHKFYDFMIFYVFQGCGFIGRNFVKFLQDNGLASVIRVVDKTPPELSYLGWVCHVIFPKILFSWWIRIFSPSFLVAFPMVRKLKILPWYEKKALNWIAATSFESYQLPLPEQQ